MGHGVAELIDDDIGAIKLKISDLQLEIARLEKEKRLAEMKVKFAGKYGKDCKHYGKKEYFCNCIVKECCDWRGCLRGGLP